jgi:hypothetical protein
MYVKSDTTSRMGRACLLAQAAGPRRGNTSGMCSGHGAEGGKRTLRWKPVTKPESHHPVRKVSKKDVCL